MALTYCFTSWRNLEVAGGLATIRLLYKQWDNQEYIEGLARKWCKAQWKKKAYDTNVSLAGLVPEATWPLGALRFLLRWRSGVGLEVWQELAARPDLAELIFAKTAGMPFWPSLCARRLLGLYHTGLYKDTCLDVGGGAKPVMDWLTGTDID